MKRLPELVRTRHDESSKIRDITVIVKKVGDTHNIFVVARDDVGLTYDAEVRISDVEHDI